MAKLEITVEVADEGILGKIAKVEEARGVLNAAISDLENCFTAKYGNYYSNPAKMQPKTVTLTNGLWNDLQVYILMTTKHREGELKAWEELAQETDENGTPKFKNAASNAQFWRDMEPQLQQILEALN